jgi:hypothetical protein
MNGALDGDSGGFAESFNRIRKVRLSWIGFQTPNFVRENFLESPPNCTLGVILGVSMTISL